MTGMTIPGRSALACAHVPQATYRRSLGTGGGDRKLAYSNKPHCFMVQPPFRNNWCKRHKLASPPRC